MRESRTYGSVRGALSNERPYRDRKSDLSRWAQVSRAVPTRFDCPRGHGADFVQCPSGNPGRAFAHPT